jgi:hypothetical protein
MKRKKAIEFDRVEDSKDLDAYDFSFNGGDETAIHVKPLVSRPPPQHRKKGLPNFGLEDS